MTQRRLPVGPILAAFALFAGTAVTAQSQINGQPPRKPPASTSGAATARNVPVRQATPTPLSGAAVCTTLVRLEPLAGAGFSSIDLGPDPSDPKYHKTSLPMPGSDCFLSQAAGKPRVYTCFWPVNPKAEDQFVELVNTLKKCPGGALDLKMAEFGDVTLHSRAADYHVAIMNSFVSLDIQAPVGAPKAPAPPAATAVAPPAASAQRRVTDWWAVSKSAAGDVAFLDANTLARQGPRVMAITYTVLKTPDKGIKAYVLRELFDCAARKEQRLNSTIFDVAGRPIGTESPGANAQSNDVLSGTLREDLMKFACGAAAARASATQVGDLGLAGLNNAAILIAR